MFFFVIVVWTSEKETITNFTDSAIDQNRPKRLPVCQFRTVATTISVIATAAAAAEEDERLVMMARWTV